MTMAEKLNGATVVDDPMSDLDKLLVKYGAEMADEFAQVTAMFAKDPVKASEMLLGITARQRERAQADLDAIKAEEAEREASLAKIVEATRASGLLAFSAVWKDFQSQAVQLPSVKLWTWQVQIDPNDESKYLEPTFIAGYAKRVSTTPATTRTPNPTARQPIEVKAKGEANYVQYASAAAAKVAILKVNGPMNKADVITKLQAAGYEVRA